MVAVFLLLDKIQMIEKQVSKQRNGNRLQIEENYNRNNIN